MCFGARVHLEEQPHPQHRQLQHSLHSSAQSQPSQPSPPPKQGHPERRQWADHVVVAPASADFMARLANGMADDLLTTVCSATEAPIALAPAMNQAMWGNHRTQRNLRLLEEDPQITLWGPDQGSQACGDVGPGRMLEPQTLFGLIEQAAQGGGQPGPLAGRRVVISRYTKC